MIHNDHTKRSTTITCPRKYQLQYIQNIFSTKGSPALRYGAVWHKALEGLYATIAEKGWGELGEGIVHAGNMAKKAWEDESGKFDFPYEDYRTLPTLMRGFVDYLQHYHGDEGFMEIVEPESVFKILIVPTKFEQKIFPGIKPFYFTGQIDLKVKLTGRKWIMEHKTTGWNLSQMIKTLHRSPQLMGYNYAAKVLDKDSEIPDGSLVSIFYTTAYKSKKTGEYGEPKFQYERQPQVFSEKDLMHWRFSFIADTYKLQKHIEVDVFPQRQHSCYTYGACTYVNICEQSRPVGQEILEGFFIDDDPWDVLKGKDDRLKVVEETREQIDRWDEMERQLL